MGHPLSSWDRIRGMGAPSRHLVALALTAALGLAGCLHGDRRRPLGERCTEDSQCETSLVCQYGRCRAECTFDRDCPEGSICVVAEDGSSRVCVDEICGPGEEECPPGLACGPDGRCREECDDDESCGDDRICLYGFCFEDPHPGSCLELLTALPWLEGRDGDYVIEPPGGPQEVYCDMTYDGGGWTRIRSFDAAAEDGCPGEWVPSYEEHDVCIVDSPSHEVGEIRSATFEPIVASYDEVRGFVRALQRGSNDGFSSREGEDVIDEPYVDGVSVTVGDPRTHLWTYVAGLQISGGAGACPCSGGSGPHAFVGDDFLCDTANTDPEPDHYIYPWYPADEWLWDGENPDPDCPSGRFEDGWFVNAASRDPAEPIEVRVMTNQGHTDEDIGVFAMELFVR